MSVETIKKVLITRLINCDACKERKHVMPEGASIDAYRRGLESGGWTCLRTERGKILDLCPRCTKNARAKKEG